MSYVWLVGMVYFAMQDNTLAILFWSVTVIATCELFKLADRFIDYIDEEIKSVEMLSPPDNPLIDTTIIEIYFNNKIWN